MSLHLGRQRQVYLWEFVASLVLIANSRPARTTRSETLSQNKIDTIIIEKKMRRRACEMARWVKALAKPGNLSLIPRTHVMEREDQPPQVVL